MSLDQADRAPLYREVSLEKPDAMNVDRLKHLEAKVEGILTLYAAACEERERLREQLDKARARLEEMNAGIRRHETERAEVKAHVERIMGRLDGLDLS